eukprot:TRINITY_DN1967_c0_g1_i1.p1 TRINITY_DN1967_c0_g1~~TRINITY_DN1967_c0_g1_i1.p1  ORF type:complete len:883 (+),score=141.90 TRINITY_DN1967_c0_g1_i1:59-2707(+)
MDPGPANSPVRLVPETGPEICLPSGSTILGRGFLGITDRHVGRRHAELMVSNESRTVNFQSLNQNPSFLQRKAGGGVVVVRKGEGAKTLENGDKILLLQLGPTTPEVSFTIQIDSGGNSQPETDLDQDATQPNMDWDIVDPQASSLPRSPAKRPRDAKAKYPGTPLKKARVSESPQKEPDSQNFSQDSCDMPGLGGVRINPKDLHFLQTVGIGSCGEVHQATWCGTSVAVKKVFRGMLTGDSLKEFKTETQILRRLRHPNVVLFMGTCKTEIGELCIVTEFMPRGNLHDVLATETIEISWDLTLKMATDIAQGMNYLHTFSPPIIHRDLKSHNLLVDESFNIKVTDFGLAKAMANGQVASTFCGTMPWTAPEIFKSQPYSTKADVYSYSIVLCELFTREEPYPGMERPQIIVGVSTAGLRPQVPDACPTEYLELIRDCWNEEPEHRPTFVNILERLRTMRPPTPLQPLLSASPLSPTALTQKFNTATEVALMHSWELEAGELKFEQEIGQGATAHVYIGRYRGQQVAIKVLKETGKILEDFKKELEVMSQIRSPKVVFLYGACLSPKFCIVTEYLPRGSLHDIMSKEEVQLDWKLALRLVTAAAEAMHVLHCWKPCIVHRDLKSPNLLVDKDWNIKVADFGLARFETSKNESSLGKLRGTFLYTAPESYNKKQYTTKSDVYSYGIILWEVVTRLLEKRYVRPFSDHKNIQFDFQVIIQTAKRNLRPTIHKDCPEPFRDLMTACWDPEPASRPDFSEVLERLKNIKTVYRRNNSRGQTESLWVGYGRPDSGSGGESDTTTTTTTTTATTNTAATSSKAAHSVADKEEEEEPKGGNNKQPTPLIIIEDEEEEGGLKPPKPTATPTTTSEGEASKPKTVIVSPYF